MAIRRNREGKGVVEFIVCLLIQRTLEHQRSTRWANRSCPLINLSFSLPASLTSRKITKLHRSGKILIFVDLMAAEIDCIQPGMTVECTALCIHLFFSCIDQMGEIVRRQADRHDVFSFLFFTLGDLLSFCMSDAIRGASSLRQWARRSCTFFHWLRRWTILSLSLSLSRMDRYPEE